MFASDAGDETAMRIIELNLGILPSLLPLNTVFLLIFLRTTTTVIKGLRVGFARHTTSIGLVSGFLIEALSVSYPRSSQVVCVAKQTFNYPKCDKIF